MSPFEIDQSLQVAFGHHQSGRRAQAEAVYRQILAVNPNHAGALHLLGVLALQGNRLDVAIDCLQKVSVLEPRNGTYLNSFGNALLAQGKVAEAIACFRRALELNADFVDAHYNLGLALKRQGKLDEAIVCYRRVLELNPGFAEAHNNLGVVLKIQGNLDEAVACYRRALELKPFFADAHNNLGNAFKNQGKLDEAVACVRRALELKPNFAEAYHTLGAALLDQWNFDEAIACFHRSLELKPDYADVHYGLGIASLLRGDFGRGWAKYEWRWKVTGFSSPRRPFPQAQWDGNPLAGQTILLHAEQGFGDALQFIRYAEMAAQSGGNVIVECRPPLKRLFQKSLEPIQVVESGQPLPHFDVHCPLMSLPMACRTTLDTVPRQVPYLHADADSVALWKSKIAGGAHCLKVGLVWAGSKTHKDDRNRSTKLAAFGPLGPFADVRFYSLQKGESAEQALQPPARMQLVDWTNELHDFADTAALIANLDLIISVDTAVAHLAGAMAKPVWTLLPFNSEWRWLIEREDSPWYPTMRLFRQRAPGGWEELIERVAEALRRFAGGEASATETEAQPPTSRPIDQSMAPDEVNLGLALKKRGKLMDAAACFRRAVGRKPDSADAHYELGNVLVMQGNIDDALACYRRSLELRPDHSESHNNAGAMLYQLRRPQEAMACFQRALELKPDNVDACNNLGGLLHDLGQFDEAIAYFRQALNRKPDFVAAHNGLGATLNRQGMLDEAESHYNETIRLRPSFADAYWNRSLLYLLRGDFERGWAEYEWRWKTKDFSEANRKRVSPLDPRGDRRWDGSPLHGRTILLHAEQGLGDTLQFIRYVHLLTETASQVIVECQPPLKRLLQHSLGQVSVFAQGEPLPAFDVHCPLLSLPMAFRTTMQNIPQHVPYVHADPELAMQWRNKIAKNVGPLKVGLAWAGNRSHKNDGNRSLPLRALAPLGRAPDIWFYSLQKRERAEQSARPPAGMQLIDDANELDDFADTAASIANLDLVISVDTAVAHLAGAMGKPVWVLLPFVPDWRWLLEREDSPWYPTMRLFRQPAAGDWSSVVHRVADALTVGRFTR